MAAKKEIEADRPLCFVVGPIGQPGSDVRKAADWLLLFGIKPVLEDPEFGFEVKRADEDANPGSITHSAIEDTIRAALVIADLSSHNPNAFYELGIRHMTNLPTIHVKADVLPVPFDNKDQRVIEFDFSYYGAVERAKERLRQAVRTVLDPDYKSSNPVTQAKGLMELQSSSDPRDQIIVTLQQRVEDLEGRYRRLLTPSAVAPALGSRMFPSSHVQDLMEQFRDPELVYTTKFPADISSVNVLQSLSPAERSIASSLANETAAGLSGNMAEIAAQVTSPHIRKRK